MKRRLMTCLLVALAVCPCRWAHGETVAATDLQYGISCCNNNGEWMMNSFAYDFTGAAPYTAGSQRSTNGFQDNHRSGRVFAQFELSSALITAAANPSAVVSLTFNVDSIGAGVSGTPYVDGLDLRYLGISAATRTTEDLWNASGVDQADILATNGSTGSHTVDLSASGLRPIIAAATPGQFVSLAFLNSAGTDWNLPVGSSVSETYGFQMNMTPSNYSLTVVPEPSTVTILTSGLVGLLAYAWRKRR